MSIEERALGAGAASLTAARARRSPRWLPVVALLAPSLFFLALFTYAPVLRVIGESLMVGRFAGEHAIGIGNYQRLFADQPQWSVVQARTFSLNGVAASWLDQTAKASLAESFEQKLTSLERELAEAAGGKAN